jgi:hypothetical protein
MASRSRRFSQPVSTPSTICSAARSITSRSLYHGRAKEKWNTTGFTAQCSRSAETGWSDRTSLSAGGDGRSSHRTTRELSRVHRRSPGGSRRSILSDADPAGSIGPSPTRYGWQIRFRLTIVERDRNPMGLAAVQRRFPLGPLASRRRPLSDAPRQLSWDRN